MANWISSKLKVAETFLQQIDQQAAESLGKTELSRSPSLSSLSDSRPTRSESAPPLKYQLPKRPPPPPSLSSPPIGSPTQPDPGPDGLPQRKPAPGPAIADDGDWTELLSTPKPVGGPSPRSNGASAKAVRKPRNSPVPIRASTRRSAGTENAKSPSRQEPDPIDPIPQDANSPASSRNSVSGVLAEGKDGSSAGWEDGLNLLEEKVAAKGSGELEGGGVKEGAERGQPGDESSASSSGSDSGSDSSDSEDERRRREERRKRREKLMAEKAAAAAAEAIRERENVVAKLEGEKQSLEKILEERERQQAQEASELQLNMMETMAAVDLEKQKHNSTRMEALASLAKLETTNTELARALATTQRNLEVEVNRIAELRQQIELKELALEELRRRMSTNQQATSSREDLKRDALEQEILDAEYSLICDKVAKLKDKAKKLEESITTTRVEIERPSELEVELKMRLTQLTDHLIQKQSQVEALSSEKATLGFRIEAVSRSLNENGSSLQATDFVYDSGVDLTSTSISVDVEAGVRQPSNVAPRRAFRERIRSGQQQLGSVVLQLDAIFSAGLVFLRRNPTAQLWALGYLVCLHLWVMYIFMSHTEVSDRASHGAVFSLDTINNTSGS